MTEKENNAEAIADGIISYLEFLKLFKKVKNDDIISQENENKNKFTYIFRQFELECYLIDKKYFDEFRKAINFNEMINILNPINEENKNKFKIEIKKYLDKNPFIPNGENIKLYSEINEMKEIIKNFNNYSFINKELLNSMGVPESKLEGKMIKFSKNGKNASLLSISNDYILSIEIEKEKDKDSINNMDNYILNKIKNDEGYDLKLNNVSYNLQIYNDYNYIYFNLFEKNEMLFYSNKYDLKSITEFLKLSRDIYIDLNKIKILFNEAYNNDKLSLTISNNNINIIIKIIYNDNEIICKIELNKVNLEINEKIEFLLKNLEKLNKNKNISLIKANLLEIENNLKKIQNSIKDILNEIKDLKKENEKEKNEIKKIDNKKYKSLDYAKEITKKVFFLLYFNEQFIQNKIKRNIKDIYNFKRYYLINKEWLKEYKQLILYDFVKKIIELEYKNKNYSFNRIIHNSNNNLKNNFGQIDFFSENKLSDFIRNAKNLIFLNKKQVIHIENNADGQDNDNKEVLSIPIEYNLVNEDLYKLLIKEDFFYNMDDNIEDITSFEVLIGNNQIIIKNKANEENEEKLKYSNEYLFYILKNKKEENRENEDEVNDNFILKYILNYDNDNIFYNDLDKILKEGLNYYFEYRKLHLDIKINNGILIKDDKNNYIGKFINIDLNKEDIKNDIGIKINEQNKENHIDSNIFIIIKINILFKIIFLICEKLK